MWLLMGVHLQQRPAACLRTCSFTGSVGGCVLFSPWFLSQLSSWFSEGEHRFLHSQSNWMGVTFLPTAVSWKMCPSMAGTGSTHVCFPPSSSFAGSYVLWPNLTHEGTQLLWALALGLLVVLRAGMDPIRLHKGAAGRRSLLAPAVCYVLKCHCRACKQLAQPPEHITCNLLSLENTSNVITFSLLCTGAAHKRLICVCRSCHTSLTGLWNMHN